MQECLLVVMYSRRFSRNNNNNKSQECLLCHIRTTELSHHVKHSPSHQWKVAQQVEQQRANQRVCRDAQMRSTRLRLRSTPQWFPSHAKTTWTQDTHPLVFAHNRGFVTHLPMHVWGTTSTGHWLFQYHVLETRLYIHCWHVTSEQGAWYSAFAGKIDHEVQESVSLRFAIDPKNRNQILASIESDPKTTISMQPGTWVPTVVSYDVWYDALQYEPLPITQIGQIDADTRVFRSATRQYVLIRTVASSPVYIIGGHLPTTFTTTTMPSLVEFGGQAYSPNTTSPYTVIPSDVVQQLVHTLSRRVPTLVSTSVDGVTRRYEAGEAGKYDVQMEYDPEEKTYCMQVWTTHTHVKETFVITPTTVRLQYTVDDQGEWQVHAIGGAKERVHRVTTERERNIETNGSNETKGSNETNETNGSNETNETNGSNETETNGSNETETNGSNETGTNGSNETGTNGNTTGDEDEEGNTTGDEDEEELLLVGSPYNHDRTEVLMTPQEETDGWGVV